MNKHYLNYDTRHISDCKSKDELLLELPHIREYMLSALDVGDMEALKSMREMVLRHALLLISTDKDSQIASSYFATMVISNVAGTKTEY